jgi:hypothetical protein
MAWQWLGFGGVWRLGFGGWGGIGRGADGEVGRRVRQRGRGEPAAAVAREEGGAAAARLGSWGKLIPCRGIE